MAKKIKPRTPARAGVRCEDCKGTGKIKPGHINLEPGVCLPCEGTGEANPETDSQLQTGPREWRQEGESVYGVEVESCYRFAKCDDAVTAALIVRAVNAHEKRTEVLRRVEALLAWLSGSIESQSVRDRLKDVREALREEA